MKQKLFLLLACLLCILVACDREETLLVTEVELPREITLIEEEVDFLRHNLANAIVEDTTGSAIYSEEFRWFSLTNFRSESYTCTVSEGRFSAQGNGTNTSGGNEEYIAFSLIGWVPDITQPFSGASFSYIAPDENGDLESYNPFCGTTIRVTVTSITEDRIKGMLTGEVVGTNDQGNTPSCDDPDLDIRTIDIDFNLRRQYCE